VAATRRVSFAAADRYFAAPHAPTQLLFLPPTKTMRRDARFAPLVRPLGLERHWRETGLWPDGCGRSGWRCPGAPEIRQASSAREAAASP